MRMAGTKRKQPDTKLADVGAFQPKNRTVHLMVKTCVAFFVSSHGISSESCFIMDVLALLNQQSVAGPDTILELIRFFSKSCFYASTISDDAFEPMLQTAEARITRWDGDVAAACDCITETLCDFIENFLQEDYISSLSLQGRIVGDSGNFESNLKSVRIFSAQIYYSVMGRMNDTGRTIWAGVNETL